jgi:hypothetical protein
VADAGQQPLVTVIATNLGPLSLTLHARFDKVLSGSFKWLQTVSDEKLKTEHSRG